MQIYKINFKKQKWQETRPCHKILLKPTQRMGDFFKSYNNLSLSPPSYLPQVPHSVLCKKVTATLLGSSHLCCYSSVMHHDGSVVYLYTTEVCTTLRNSLQMLRLPSLSSIRTLRNGYTHQPAYLIRSIWACLD